MTLSPESTSVTDAADPLMGADAGQPAARGGYELVSAETSAAGAIGDAPVATLTPARSGCAAWKLGSAAFVTLLVVGALGYAAVDIRTAANAPAMRGHARHNMVVTRSPEKEAKTHHFHVIADEDEENVTKKHHNGTNNGTNVSDSSNTSNATSHQKVHHKPACDTDNWPDKDHGLVCGECKVLVNKFNFLYETCDNYCNIQGRECTGAWEERGDTCAVMHTINCSQYLPSSDAICECGEKVDKTLKADFEQRIKNKRHSACGPVANNSDFWTDGPLSTNPNVKSAAGCQAMCRSSPACSAWTWGEQTGVPGLDHTCFLKKVAFGHTITRKRKVGLVSGHPYGPDCDLFEPSYYTKEVKHEDNDEDEDEDEHKHGHHHHHHEESTGWDKKVSGNVQGVIRNKHGFCLDAAEPHKEDGDIQMMYCAPGAKSQEWSYTQKTGQIKNKHGLCLASESRDDLARLHTLKCDTTDWNQQWDFFNLTATIKNWRGPCLDAGERNIDGGMTYLRSCDEHSWNQRWEFGALANMTLYKGAISTKPMSLYCFALMLPGSYEQGLLAMQYNAGVSLFACEAYAVYSNKVIKVAGNLTTGVVDSDLKCKKGGEFGTALNLPIFLAVWKKVVADAVFMKHDWTAKVDPDAVFFPQRLRSILSIHPETENGVYLNNCKYGLHGPLEVFSRNAVVTWSKGTETCVKHFNHLCHGDCEWGEDLFVDQCLFKVLNVTRDNDYRVLVEDHCDPPEDWAECTDPTRVAFHPFKKEVGYRKCMDNATQADKIRRLEKPISAR